MSKTIEDYIEFVQEQIKKFQENNRLITKDEILPETLNRALGEYGVVSAALIAEYQRAKLDEYQANAEFDDWWDAQVAAAREEVLSNVEGKKYPAYKEYELVAKERNADQYREMQDAIVAAERKVSFMLRLLDTYKKMDQILVNLSLNMRSELRALSLEDRMNANPRKKKARRTVKTTADEVGDEE